MSKTIKYKGVDVVYSQTGSGQTLVLLHGFLEDKSMWHDFVSELSTEFRVITPDLLGQGETGTLGYVHSMEDMAQSVHCILEAEKVDRFTVIGHSMGGYVALAMADSDPDKIDRLVLFHSTSFPDSDERKNDRERVIRLVQRGKSIYTKTVIPSLFSEEWRVKLKSEIEELIEMANSYSDRGIIANLRGMMDRKNRSGVLKDATFPKLIVHGELDSVITTADIEEQAALNANIELQKIEAIGHMGHLEARDKTLGLIKTFCLN